jgi:hypothetical protein
MAEDANDRIRRGDGFLSQMSWDRTWARMSALIDEAVAKNHSAAQAPQRAVIVNSAAHRAGSAVVSGD